MKFSFQCLVITAITQWWEVWVGGVFYKWIILLWVNTMKRNMLNAHGIIEPKKSESIFLLWGNTVRTRVQPCYPQRLGRVCNRNLKPHGFWNKNLLFSRRYRSGNLCCEWCGFVFMLLAKVCNHNAHDCRNMLQNISNFFVAAFVCV